MEQTSQPQTTPAEPREESMAYRAGIMCASASIEDCREAVGEGRKAAAYMIGANFLLNPKAFMKGFLTVVRDITAASNEDAAAEILIKFIGDAKLKS